jgi:dihydrofolate synthase/folylpolyglutamate synthase
MSRGQAPGHVPSGQAWIESLSPWPRDGFGLERIRALLAELGDPQRAYPAVHVVGTNGKTTATRTIAALLRSEGLRVGAYTSPHVSGWHERLDCDPDTFERAVTRVRQRAEWLGATQFEALTAAALAEFRAQGVDVAVVEAGLGGRLDATNVLDAPVVFVTNVGLEHTDVLGSTRDEIAREKLAVVRSGAVVVLGEPEWEPLVEAKRVMVGDARAAAEAFLGHPVEHEVDVHVLGRFDRRSDLELWDGAHTPEGVEWLLERLPHRGWVVVASILADKRVDEMLSLLSGAGDTFVATRSSNLRALPAETLAEHARPHFRQVETVADPARARERALELGPVLVTGSLYLLADLFAILQDAPCPSPVRA